MNCPQCDSFMYKAGCPCGWSLPAVSTSQIKMMGAQESSYPVEINPDLKQRLEANPLKDTRLVCLEFLSEKLNIKINRGATA